MRISSNSIDEFLRHSKGVPFEGNVDDLFSLENPQPYLVITVDNGPDNPLGYLVIDTLVPGICSGGIRMVPDVTIDELTHLARAMTLKFAFKNSYIGGAKAGIILPPNATNSQKLEALETFGQKLGPIMRTLYSLGGDIGIGPEELDIIKKGAGLDVQKTPGTYKSGFCTAFGVFASAKTVAQKRGKDLSGCTIAMEGYGNVGKPLARLLDREGCRIVALSTIYGGLYNEKGLDIDRLEKSADRWGDHVVEKFDKAEKIEKAALFTANVDILIPGARPWSIDENNAANVKAIAIVPAANIPVTRKAANILIEKDVMYIPEFVTTGGGILGGQLFNRGFKQEEVMSIMTKTFESKLTKLMDLADAHGSTIEDQALQIAKANFIRGKKEAAVKRSRMKYYAFLLKKEKSIMPMVHRAAARLYLGSHRRFKHLKKLIKGPAMADAFRYASGDLKYYPRLSHKKKTQKNTRRY